MEKRELEISCGILTAITLLMGIFLGMFLAELGLPFSPYSYLFQLGAISLLLYFLLYGRNRWKWFWDEPE